MNTKPIVLCRQRHELEDKRATGQGRRKKRQEKREKTTSGTWNTRQPLVNNPGGGRGPEKAAHGTCSVIQRHLYAVITTAHRQASTAPEEKSKNKKHSKRTPIAHVIAPPWRRALSREGFRSQELLYHTTAHIFFNDAGTSSFKLIGGWRVCRHQEISAYNQQGRFVGNLKNPPSRIGTP